MIFSFYRRFGDDKEPVQGSSGGRPRKSEISPGTSANFNPNHIVVKNFLILLVGGGWYFERCRRGKFIFVIRNKAPEREQITQKSKSKLQFNRLFSM